MNITADRGGPFVRSTDSERNWMRASPPGIAFRFAADESSPIGGDGHDGVFHMGEGTMAWNVAGEAGHERADREAVRGGLLHGTRTVAQRARTARRARRGARTTTINRQECTR